MWCLGHQTVEEKLGSKIKTLQTHGNKSYEELLGPLCDYQSVFLYIKRGIIAWNTLTRVVVVVVTWNVSSKTVLIAKDLSEADGLLLTTKQALGPKKTSGPLTCGSFQKFCWSGGAKKMWNKCLFSEPLGLISYFVYFLSISCVREVLKGIHHSAICTKIIINLSGFCCFVCFMAKLTGTLIHFFVVCDFQFHELILVIQWGDIYI